MLKLSKIMGQGLVLGALMLAMALPGQAFAEDTAPTINANGVVTSTGPYGSPVQGYYDQNGCFQYGWKPYLLGFYDGNGDWHDYPYTEVIPGYFTTDGIHHDGAAAVSTYNDAWRYKYSKSNFYAGYGSKHELDCGRTRVIGCDSQPHWVDLKTNRSIVHLKHDNKLQLYIVNQFEPVGHGHPHRPHRHLRHRRRRVRSQSDLRRRAAVCRQGHHHPEPGLLVDVHARRYVQHPERLGRWTMDCHYAGLTIHVHGDDVAFDDSAFTCCRFWTVRRLPFTYTRSVFHPFVMPNTPATPQTPPPPAPKKPHHKKVLRNKDIK